VMLEFPAIAEKDEKWRKKGDPLFPEHKDLAFLLERKALMSPGSWQAEYQQHPVLIGDSTFPVEKLRVVQVFQRSDIASSVLSIDKAGTVDGGAYTARITAVLADVPGRRRCALYPHCEAGYAAA